MKRVVEEVRAADGGTDQINHHPVCRLYAEQIAHLTGAGVCGDFESYHRAYDECETRATGETEAA